jgi:hypothetical protein
VFAATQVKEFFAINPTVYEWWNDYRMSGVEIPPEYFTQVISHEASIRSEGRYPRTMLIPAIETVVQTLQPLEVALARVGRPLNWDAAMSSIRIRPYMPYDPNAESQQEKSIEVQQAEFAATQESKVKKEIPARKCRICREKFVPGQKWHDLCVWCDTNGRILSTLLKHCTRAHGSILVNEDVYKLWIEARDRGFIDSTEFARKVELIERAAQSAGGHPRTHAVEPELLICEAFCAIDLWTSTRGYSVNVSAALDVIFNPKPRWGKNRRNDKGKKNAKQRKPKPAEKPKVRNESPKPTQVPLSSIVDFDKLENVKAN